MLLITRMDPTINIWLKAAQCCMDPIELDFLGIKCRVDVSVAVTHVGWLQLLMNAHSCFYSFISSSPFLTLRLCVRGGGSD